MMLDHHEASSSGLLCFGNSLLCFGNSLLCFGNSHRLLLDFNRGKVCGRVAAGRRAPRRAAVPVLAIVLAPAVRVIWGAEAAEGFAAFANADDVSDGEVLDAKLARALIHTRTLAARAQNSCARGPAAGGFGPLSAGFFSFSRARRRSACPRRCQRPRKRRIFPQPFLFHPK